MIEFFGKEDVCPASTFGGSSFPRARTDDTWWPGTRNSQIRFQRWKILENWFDRRIGWHMLSLWQGGKPCSRCRISCESNRRIFCINPTKQRTAFFGVGRDESDAGRRRQKRDRRRVNNLEKVKAQGVGYQRQHQESREDRPLTSRGIPGEEKRFGGNLGGNAVHRGGVAASATDVMPCSSAEFVT